MLFGTLDHISPVSGDIVGRRVSHYEFIKALIRYSSFREYHFFPGDAVTTALSRETLKELAGITDNVKRVKILGRDQIPRYIKSRNYTVFHRHDPQIEPLCYMRDRFASSAFPITGFIHSISYQRLQHDFFNTIAANTYPFDSILCTSSAAKEAMIRLFDSVSEGLKKRFSASLRYNGRFDYLPFGVDTDRFMPAKDEDRILIRRKMGLPENSLLLLTVSRFSQYSKMDMYPIVRKLKRLIVKYTPIFYVLAGSGYESDYPEKIKEFADGLGIGDNIIIMKDIDESVKADLYRSSDVFISPSDNHQESFGLTIAEAMSSGLPVIASNWSGYRDIVEDGRTGLLVHTLWGECDSAITDLAPISFEREYHLHLGQSVAVDVNHLYTQLEKIILDRDVRTAMGISARKRAEQKFSWKTIIEDYEKLVIGLKRASDKHECKDKGKNDYLFLMKYFKSFSHYPSKILGDEDILTLSEYGTDVINKKAKIIIYEDMKNILDMELMLIILQNVFERDMSVSEIKGIFKNSHHPSYRIVYCILWMIKYDFLKHC